MVFWNPSRPGCRAEVSQVISELWAWRPVCSSWQRPENKRVVVPVLVDEREVVGGFVASPRGPREPIVRIEPQGRADIHHAPGRLTQRLPANAGRIDSKNGSASATPVARRKVRRSMGRADGHSLETPEEVALHDLVNDGSVRDSRPSATEATMRWTSSRSANSTSAPVASVTSCEAKWRAIWSSSLSSRIALYSSMSANASPVGVAPLGSTGGPLPYGRGTEKSPYFVSPRDAR